MHPKSKFFNFMMLMFFVGYVFTNILYFNC